MVVHGPGRRPQAHLELGSQLLSVRRPVHPLHRRDGLPRRILLAPRYAGGPAYAPLYHAGGPAYVPLHHAGGPAYVPLHHAGGPAYAPLHHAGGPAYAPCSSSQAAAPLVRLVPGQPVSGALEEGGWAYYIFSHPEGSPLGFRISLQPRFGEADAFVTRAPGDSRASRTATRR